MQRRSFIVASAAGMTLAASALAFSQASSKTAVKTGCAPVNGLNLYYEIHGMGGPLILLHGGLGAGETVITRRESASSGRISLNTYAAEYPARTFPCQRFDAALASGSA